MGVTLVNLPGFIYGIPDEKVRKMPVVGLPSGTIKYRLRWRNTAFGAIFTRGDYGTRFFYIREQNGVLFVDPEFEQGHNQ